MTSSPAFVRERRNRQTLTETEMLALAAVGANRLREARRHDDGRRLVLGRWELSIEGETQSVAVKLALPGSHDNRRDRIPDHVDERASLAHEAVDPENQRHARQRDRRHDRKR